MLDRQQQQSDRAPQPWRWAKSGRRRKPALPILLEMAKDDNIDGPGPSAAQAVKKIDPAAAKKAGIP